MEQVYIFDFGDKIKAGYSTNVKKRLRTIELSAGVTAKRIYSVQAGRTVEKLLHRRLENRLLGEFFAFPFDRAKELLDEIVANYIPPVASVAQRRGDVMTIEQKLKMALSYKGISQSELARRLQTTPQNLSQKVKRNTLTKEEMEQIAIALGGTWRAEFVFEDGTVI